MVIRYKWVQFFNIDKNTKLTKLNCLSIGIGAVSCFGMTMVANFQVGLTFNIMLLCLLDLCRFFFLIYFSTIIEFPTHTYYNFLYTCTCI